jgi:hypothetical protein
MYKTSYQLMTVRVFPEDRNDTILMWKIIISNDLYDGRQQNPNP